MIRSHEILTIYLVVHTYIHTYMLSLYAHENDMTLLHRLDRPSDLQYKSGFSAWSNRNLRLLLLMYPPLLECLTS